MVSKAFLQGIVKEQQSKLAAGNIEIENREKKIQELTEELQGKSNLVERYEKQFSEMAKQRKELIDANQTLAKENLTAADVLVTAFNNLSVAHKTISELYELEGKHLDDMIAEKKKQM